MYASDGVLRPASASVEKISEEGNASIAPMMLNNSFIGVGKDNSLFYQKFTWQGQAYDRYRASDFARHLFQGKKVKETAFCRVPENSFYVLFTDGSLVKLFLRESDGAIAWSRVELAYAGGGVVAPIMAMSAQAGIATDSQEENKTKIVSICAIEDDGFARLWIATENGDILVSDVYDDKQPCYMDYYEKLEIQTDDGGGWVGTMYAPTAQPPAGFTFPARFVGKDFSVVAYNDKGAAWIGHITAYDGSPYTLPEGAVAAYAGFEYPVEIETLDLGGADDDYSAKKGRIDTVQLYLFETYALMINGVPLQFKGQDELYMTAFGGKYNKIRLNGGYSYEKTVKISSRSGLPFVICALNLSVGGDF